MAIDTKHTAASEAPDTAVCEAGLAPTPGDSEFLQTAEAFAEKANDLQALRDAVVDAASVGAGLWLSYLFVLFYFLIAVGSVTHQDLLMERPVKLPFLSVDLPVLGFFWLGPAIFLIVHAYVLLHFVLLGGKVGDFDEELHAQIADAEVRRRLRRQLPSNIFVQFLAGPLEVRSGKLGFLLRLIAQISLVIGPIALLVFFELQFLPYHHQWITWWHRIAVLTDIILLWTLWPSIARGERVGLSWADLRRGEIVVLALASTAPLLLVTTIATFPGEWLEDTLPSLRFIPWKDEQRRTRRLASLHELLVGGEIDLVARKPRSLWSNRLVLPGFDAIDHTTLDSEAKIEAASKTISLRGRHLEGAVMTDAKLRKADFTGAQLQGAHLSFSDLRGAKFDCAQEFPTPSRALVILGYSAKEYSARCAQLQGAWLNAAQLQGASLIGAQLQGAWLTGAQLLNASLVGARLQGAELNDANLQGAWLADTQLQGALLHNAELQGASLILAGLQGASLDHAQLQGTLLVGVQLQGASLEGAELEGAQLLKVVTWRADARKAAWKDARVIDSQSIEKYHCKNRDGDISNCSWSPESFNELKRMISEEVIDVARRHDATERIMQRLDPAKPLVGEDEIAKVWEYAARSSPPEELYEKRVIGIWRETGCAADSGPYVVRAWLDVLGLKLPPFQAHSLQLSTLAAAYLDEEHCPSARGLTDTEKAKLKEVRDRSPPPAPKK
jgi:uncharacterized protein YjbI with pentapeptide repeats